MCISDVSPSDCAIKSYHVTRISSQILFYIVYRNRNNSVQKCELFVANNANNMTKINHCKFDKCKNFIQLKKNILHTTEMLSNFSKKYFYNKKLTNFARKSKIYFSQRYY